jgi:hypothetical protein
MRHTTERAIKMKVGRIVRRFFLYLGLALASLAVFTLVFALSIRTHIVVPFRWVMLTTFTVLIIIAMINGYRRYWARPAFWLIAAGMLTIHLTVFIVILRNYPEFRPVWFLPAVIAEGGAFGVICGLLLDRATANRRREHSSRV